MGEFIGLWYLNIHGNNFKKFECIVYMPTNNWEMFWSEPVFKGFQLVSLLLINSSKFFHDINFLFRLFVP